MPWDISHLRHLRNGNPTVQMSMGIGWLRRSSSFSGGFPSFQKSSSSIVMILTNEAFRSSCSNKQRQKKGGGFFSSSEDTNSSSSLQRGHARGPRCCRPSRRSRTCPSAAAGSRPPASAGRCGPSCPAAGTDFP